MTRRPTAAERRLSAGQRRVLMLVKQYAKAYPASGVPTSDASFVEGLRRRGLIRVQYRMWLTDAGRAALTRGAR